jgi:hypothetical protein
MLVRAINCLASELDLMTVAPEKKRSHSVAKVSRFQKTVTLSVGLGITPTVQLSTNRGRVWTVC